MGVDDVAVVGDRIRFMAVAHDEGLGVGQQGAAGGRIAHVSDSASAAELFEVSVVEYIRYQSHSFMGIDLFVAGNGNAGAFLAPMLERVNPEVSDAGRFGMIENTEQAAGLARSLGLSHGWHYTPVW